MIYPITIYGNPVLRKETVDIDKDYPELQQLIEDMFKTLYRAEGVGLAAPQIGLSIRLFVRVWRHRRERMTKAAFWRSAPASAR